MCQVPWAKVGSDDILLIMEEVLSIKMLNLKNKSHLYHLGRGGGGGGKEGEGKATAFLLSQ